MHPNTLINEIALVNSLPIDQTQKDEIIAKLIVAAIAVAEAQSTTPEQLTANMAALQKVVPPTHSDAMGKQVLDSAHESEVEQIMKPGGIKGAEPVGGWPPRDPDQSSETHKDSDFVHVNSQGGPDNYYTFPGWKERQEKPLPHDNPAKFTAAQKMAMQYTISCQHNRQKAQEWLASQLSPMDAAELDQMFGSSGSALLYNPYAGSILGYMSEGASVDDAKKRLAGFAATETSDGSKESIAKLDDAWFAQAAATVAQFK
jgi:hypothetical protein